jgi:hypothetical protein
MTCIAVQTLLASSETRAEVMNGRFSLRLPTGANRLADNTTLAVDGLPLREKIWLDSDSFLFAEEVGAVEGTGLGKNIDALVALLRKDEGSPASTLDSRNAELQTASSTKRHS